jgi:hypothetical protein
VIDYGVRYRRGWIIAGVLAAVLVGEAALYGWLRWISRPPERWDTASVRDGEVTFHIPHGWRTGACGHSDCLTLRTPRGSVGVITVDAIVPSPPTPGTRVDVTAMAMHPATLPGARSFTVDGVRFTRWHTDAATKPAPLPGATSAFGRLRDGSTVFISCVEKGEPDLVRSGCAVVLDSLHIRQ